MLLHNNKRVDEIDFRILTLLQKDATLPVKDIAKRVGLSTTPCWARIQKLQENGFIKNKTAILNPEKMGFNNRVFIFIKTNKHKKEWANKFKNYILNQENVMGLYRISGNYDYLINVLAKDVNDFDIFYQNLIENIEVYDVSSSFVMEVMKENTEIPVNFKNKPT